MLVSLFIVILISSVNSQSGHPEFDPPMEQIVLLEGYFENSTECIAKGELPLTYTWYNQSDAEITSDANQDIYTYQSGNGSLLIFTEVKSSYAGLYSCSATNRHGTATKTYDVIVSTSSGNITTNETAEIISVKVANITENSVEFIVRTTGDLDSFYIRYKERLAKEEKWVQILKGNKAVVRDLVPAGRYEFRFQIESPNRNRISTTPYYVTLLPDIPDVIFRTIKDGFVEIEWFQSTDDFTRRTIEEYELSYSLIQQYDGRTWKASKCVITVKIPFDYCSPNRYTIAGLEKRVYYEIRLRKRTSSGYGKAYINKVHIL